MNVNIKLTSKIKCEALEITLALTMQMDFMEICILYVCLMQITLQIDRLKFYESLWAIPDSNSHPWEIDSSFWKLMANRMQFQYLPSLEAHSISFCNRLLYFFIPMSFT